MKYFYLLFIFWLIANCSTTPNIPTNASTKDPTIYIIMDPCSCSRGEWEQVAQKKILWNSLDDYMLQNHIVLGDDIKSEILETPKRFLYDFSLDQKPKPADPPKDKEKPKKKDTTPPESKIYIYNETKGSWNTNKKLYIADPETEDYSNQPDSDKKMNFNGYEGGWQTHISTTKKPLAKAKLNHNEVNSFLKKKPSKKVGSGYKAYGNAMYRNRGLEVIQSFRSGREKHRQKLRQRQKYRMENRRKLWPERQNY